MFRTTATITNAYGIHCRPSAVISKAIKDYAGKIEVTSSDGATANPTSVLGLLSLGLTCGDTVDIKVEGPDEEATAMKLAELFATHFDFER